MITQIDAYEVRHFAAPLASGHMADHDVYSRGDGPPVVIIQELPGIGQETLALADQFVASGFAVVLPHLFGPIGRTSMVGNIVRTLCMRREFTLFSRNASSPVADWLKALCNDVRDRSGHPGVGVIGMCLTGNFAISLVADDAVLAAVASQPSLPIHTSDGMHMSADEIAASRAALDAGRPMLALRFEGDSLCNAARFDTINRHMNDDAERVRLRTLPGKGHSVLTLDFCDEPGHPTRAALDEVTDYFRATLTPS